MMFDMTSRNFRSWLPVGGMWSLLSLALLWGCGGGLGDDLPTAKAAGTVTADGKPVDGGELIFAPSGKGKNATGTVGADGQFTLSTYANGDGAIIGTHHVTFIPAIVAAPEGAAGAHTPTPVSPYAGMVPETAEVTISKGSNTVDVKLVKRTK